MSENEVIPVPFCTGVSLPIACHQYSAGDMMHAAKQLHYSSTADKEVSPVFLYGEEHKELLRELSTKPLAFTKTRAWVMPLTYASVLPLRLDSNILFYERTSQDSFTVYESFAIKGGNTKTSVLFKWPEEELNNPNPTKPLNLLEKRANLDGAILKNAWHSSSWNKYKDNLTNNNNSVVAKNVEMLFDLQAQLNFSIKHVPPRDKAWGGKSKNGTWNGLVRMLIDNQIDMTFGMVHTGVMITQERQEVVDYCWPTENVKIDLLTALSSKPRLDAWAYVNIFPLTAWLTGIVSLFVAALCFTVSSHEPMSQSLALMIRLFLQLGYEVPTGRLASKALLLVAALSLNLIFIYYTCDLTARMTSEPPDIGIKSFKDVESQGYRVVTLPFGFQPHDLIANAPDGSAKKRIHENNMHEVVSGGNVGANNKEIIRRVKDDPKLLTFGGVTAGGSMEKNLVALEIIDGETMLKSMALQKDSEFGTLFNHHILMMIESGKIERIKYQWEGKHNQNYEMEEAVVLRYEHVLFPYSWLALGITMSIPIILAEMMSKRLAKTRLVKAAIPHTVAGNAKQIMNFGQLMNDHQMLTESLMSERETTAKLAARIKALSRERDSLKKQVGLNLAQVSD